MTERSTHDQVRRAVPDDAEELTRLRALMFRDMGRPADLLDEAWSRRNVEHFHARLADTESFAAFVVDQPDAGLAAVAVGWLDQHLIGPTNPSGQVGYVANICTDSAFRRRGYSRNTHPQSTSTAGVSAATTGHPQGQRPGRTRPCS